MPDTLDLTTLSEEPVESNIQVEITDAPEETEGPVEEPVADTEEPVEVAPEASVEEAPEEPIEEPVETEGPVEEEPEEVTEEPVEVAPEASVEEAPEEPIEEPVETEGPVEEPEEVTEEAPEEVAGPVEEAPEEPIEEPVETAGPVEEEPEEVTEEAPEEVAGPVEEAPEEPIEEPVETAGPVEEEPEEVTEEAPEEVTGPVEEAPVSTAPVEQVASDIRNILTEVPSVSSELSDDLKQRIAELEYLRECCGEWISLGRRGKSNFLTSWENKSVTVDSSKDYVNVLVQLEKLPEIIKLWAERKVTTNSNHFKNIESYNLTKSLFNEKSNGEKVEVLEQLITLLTDCANGKMRTNQIEEFIDNLY